MHFSLDLNCKILLGHSVLYFSTLLILASTSHLLARHSVTYLFFITFQRLSMGFMSGEFPGHSWLGIFYHSRNVLVLLELWHGMRSCINIYPSCRSKTHSRVISMSWIISLWYFALSMLPFTFSEETGLC